VVIEMPSEIKLSVWFVEIWQPQDAMWRPDGVYTHQKYAANHIATMSETLSAGEAFRMRRFVQEGRTPRGSKVGGRGNG
jgi:hypothetical protein